MNVEEAGQLFLSLGPQPVHDAVKLPILVRVVLSIHGEEGGVEAREEDRVEPRGVQLALPPGGNVVGYGPSYKLVSGRGGQQADASSWQGMGGVIASDHLRTIFPKTWWQ